MKNSNIATVFARLSGALSSFIRMKFTKSDFSTVLIVGKNQTETQAVRIKTKHLRRLKHYAFTIAIILFCLTGTIIFLTLEISKYNAERLAFNKQILELRNLIPPPRDTMQATNYIQKIEGKLEKINQYLIKRGISGFLAKDVGGNSGDGNILSDEETYALYNARLEDILMGVAFTPIGYPSNFVMTSSFGYRGDPMGSGRIEFHSGLDFRGRKGDAVKSTADGKVILAGWYQGYGNCVRIRHKNNLETLYGHLSKVNVRSGEMVTTGQVIGKVGSTGHSTGNHLHYEVRKNGKPINPKNFLSLN